MYILLIMPMELLTTYGAPKVVLGQRRDSRTEAYHRFHLAVNRDVDLILSIRPKEPLARKKNELGIPAWDTPRPMPPSP